MCRKPYLEAKTCNSKVAEGEQVGATVLGIKPIGIPVY